MGKVIIFSAPSGSGKTTIVRELLKRFPQFEFSVSATSRAPRGCERHGCDYHFMTHEEFLRAVFDLTNAPQFDQIVVNYSLDEAIRETTAIIDQFIARQP